LLFVSILLAQNSFEFAHHLQGTNTNIHLSVGDSNNFVMLPLHMFHSYTYNVQKKEIVTQLYSHPISLFSYFADGSDFAINNFFDYDIVIPGLAQGSFKNKIYKNDFYYCKVFNNCADFDYKSIVHCKDGLYLFNAKTNLDLFDTLSSSFIKKYNLSDGFFMKNKENDIHFINKEALYKFNLDSLSFIVLDNDVSAFTGISSPKHAVYNSESNQYYFLQTENGVSKVYYYSINGKEKIDLQFITLPDLAVDAIVNGNEIYWIQDQSRKLHTYTIDKNVDMVTFEDYNPSLIFERIYRQDNYNYISGRAQIQDNYPALLFLQQHKDGLPFISDRNDLSMSMEKLEFVVLDTFMNPFSSYKVRMTAKAFITNNGPKEVNQFNVITGHPFSNYFSQNFVFNETIKPHETKEVIVNTETYTPMLTGLILNYYLLGADCKVDSDYSNNSASLSFSVSTDDTKYDDILIAPSPAKDIITIKTDHTYKKFIILNTLGKHLIHSSSNEVDISHLPPGLYYVVCIGNDRMVTKPFLKIQ
jgi:hypothetical protein